MRIAFHAPLKPPDHPTPSGDRMVARLFLRALDEAGHDVFLASRFRSFDRGDPRRQERLERLGGRLAGRLAARLDRPGRRPDLWLTYHLYHKAPDHLGPRIADRLGIPYAVAEASLAEKARTGPWARGHQAVERALGRADLVFLLNPADRAGIPPALRPGIPIVDLPPFIDTAPFRDAGQRDRAALRAAHRLDEGLPLLLAVGMMRADQKQQSYAVLADALLRPGLPPFQLAIVGDGPAEAEIRAMFAGLGARARFLGRLAPEHLPPLFAVADLFVWPAVKEAFGMAFIEAQAAGTPVIGGRSGGVPAVVADGETGLLVSEGDAGAFAEAVAALLLDPERRRRMGVAAASRACQRHDIGTAAQTLDAALRGLIERAPARAVSRALPQAAP